MCNLWCGNLKERSFQDQVCLEHFVVNGGSHWVLKEAIAVTEYFSK